MDKQEAHRQRRDQFRYGCLGVAIVMGLAVILIVIAFGFQGAGVTVDAPPVATAGGL